MQQINPSFNLVAAQIQFSQAQLFIEAGPAGISLLVLDELNCFKAVAVYVFGTTENETVLKEKTDAIFQSEPLFKETYSRTHIFWSFPESVLVPAELMNAERNQQMLNLVFGDAMEGIVRSDFIYKHNLHNVYRTPQQIVDLFANHLPVATQTHLFSTLINKDLPADNHIYSVFYSNSITIMLSCKGKLQVVQNFTYTDSVDCVFHLLNVCKGFDVIPDSATLHISGLIDADSELYATVYKYFLNINFNSLPQGYTYMEEINNHPPHFFSHLFALASCV